MGKRSEIEERQELLYRGMEEGIARSKKVRIPNADSESLSDADFVNSQVGAFSERVRLNGNQVVERNTSTSSSGEENSPSSVELPTVTPANFNQNHSQPNWAFA